MMRIRLLFLGAAILFLCACSATGSVPKEYLLPGSRPEAVDKTGTDLTAVRIYPVSLPEFLQERRMVIIGESGRIHRARHHQWAEPLADQLGRIVRVQLAAALPEIDWREASTPGERSCPGLLIRVDDFQVKDSGRALISGHWRLFTPKGDTLVKERFRKDLPLPEAGYPAMVRVLSRGWTEVIWDVARDLAETRIN
ncbi:MAG: membrane integrity-associated transporter subunit PqiC [Desulfonatronovibrionaceae bacterium]